MFRDPLFFLGIAGLLFITCQALNGPRAVGYDATAIVWRAGPPPLAGLPSCFDRAEAFQAFFWLLPAWAAVLAIRHGLTRRGRLRLLHVLAALSTLLAVFCLLQYAWGDEWKLWGQAVTADHYGIFAYSGFAAAFFSIMFLISGGLLITALAEDGSKWRLRMLYAAVVLNMVAAAFTLEHAALLLVAVGGLAGIVYAGVYLKHRLPQVKQLKYMAVLLLTLGGLAFLHFVAYPENALHARSKRSNRTGRNSGWFGERQVLCDAARRIFKAYPAYGTATWGFRHEVGRFLTDADWERIVSGTQHPITCFCDPRQFLCELGLVGSGMLLLAIVLLLIPVCRRIHRLMRATDASLAESRLQRIPPVAVTGLAALLGVAIMGCYDMSFRDPLVILAVHAAALLRGDSGTRERRWRITPLRDAEEARRWNPFSRRVNSGPA